MADLARWAIRADRLSRNFGALRALDGVTFDIAFGEVFGLLGPNGAGKTTTVRLLTGLLAPSGGGVRVLGLSPVASGCELRRQTGVLTETPSLYERLTARQNLRFYAELYNVPRSEVEGRVEKVLALFGLSERADDQVGRFSKGMKQRLALARALVHDPRLLFLDEPTSGLDPEASRQVLTLIEQLSREGGRTIVLCTHNLGEAERLCDRVAVLTHGRLLALGTPGELARDLWRGLWVDVVLREPPAPALVARLRARFGDGDVNVEGAHLAVQVDREETTPTLVAELVAGGGQVLRVTPQDHSLEEVYFALQRRLAPPVPVRQADAGRGDRNVQ